MSCAGVAAGALFQGAAPVALAGYYILRPCSPGYKGRCRRAAVHKPAESFDNSWRCRAVRWNEDAGILCTGTDCGFIDLFSLDY